MVSGLALLLLVCAAVGASAISAVVGMAGGVILLSIMTFFMDLSVIVPVHGVVQLVSNSTRSLSLVKYIHRRIFFATLIGWPFGTALSISLIQSIEHRELFYFLIGFLIFYVVLKPKNLPSVAIPYWGFGILTFVAGLLNPIIGATGPMLAPFFLRDDLNKEEIVATKAATQTVGHLLKIPAFLALGFDYQTHWLLILVMVLGVILGTRLGVRILGILNERVFRWVFKAALLAAGLRVLYKGIQAATELV